MPSTLPGTSPSKSIKATGRPLSPVDRVLARFPDSSSTFVASAPLRLDVMGGLSDYTGSLVLNMPLGEYVCVGAQRCREAALTIDLVSSDGRADGRQCTIPIGQLLNGDCVPHTALNGSDNGQDPCDEAIRCMVGAFAEMVRAGVLRVEGGGLRLVGTAAQEYRADLGQTAALAASTMVSLAGTVGLQLDQETTPRLCQRVENHWLEAPVGVADAVCALRGEAGTVSGMHGDTGTVVAKLRVPDELSFVAIDCGVTNPERRLKYARVRTTAFMGRSLIDRIIAHDGAESLEWSGCLSQIPVADFVERFRDRLPMRLKGSEYLARFGETGDPLTRVDPAFSYKIRSRTEHHVYEHSRARELLDCLQRAIRAGDRAALVEAGEIMYASHWSYGQRCGLGSIESDALVHRIRQLGAGAGLYGAKVTGRGCGSLVAVLMSSDERATSALDAVLNEYRSETGHQAAVVAGSQNGALLRDAQRHGRTSPP